MSISSVKHDLSWFSFPSRVVRLCVFKVAVLPGSTCYERYFLGCRLFGTLPNFNLERAKETIQALKVLGTEHRRVPSDGEANIQLLHFRASEIKKSIERLGGTWEKYGDQIVILAPDHPDREWREFHKILKRVFPNEIQLNGKEGLLTCDQAQNIPFGDPNKKTECVLLAKLAKTFAMDKFDIAYYLGMGLDVCTYDARGSLESEGYPTEAGLYHDIESVGDFLFQENGYDPARTLIYGSCGESFTAIHLFKQYYDQGINLFLQNAPLSLERVISRINFIARWIFNWVKTCIQAPPHSCCNQSQEDYFDSEAKIRSLGIRDCGYVLLAQTEGDTTAPPSEIDEMGGLLTRRGNKITFLNNRAGEAMPDGANDPHLAQPIRNPRLQETIHQALFVP